jgi:hypothetical protein
MSYINEYMCIYAKCRFYLRETESVEPLVCKITMNLSSVPAPTTQLHRPRPLPLTYERDQLPSLLHAKFSSLYADIPLF